MRTKWLIPQILLSFLFSFEASSPVFLQLTA
jgi:hypothetical protein